MLRGYGARLVLAGLLPVVLATVSGCATAGGVVVRPWERETLAKRVMQFDPDPTEVRLREGVLGYREGSTGALGTKGGGCGCD